MKDKIIEDEKITWDDSQEAKDRIYNICLKWFMDNEQFCGEVICQSDKVYETGPELISEIAEEGFMFKVDYL